MKMLLLAIHFVIPSLVNANTGEVYDGYARYYSSLEGAVFKSSDVRTLQPGRTLSDATTMGKGVFSWQGMAHGKRYSFLLVDRSIYESDDEGPKESFVLNGKKFYFKQANIFPGELSKIDARSASLYISKSYLCLEGVGFTSSGSAARHVDVYLLALAPKNGKQNLYKLPSLFASCFGVRLDKSGGIVFPKVSYRDYESVNAAAGVSFQDYTFKAGQFAPIGPEIQASFVEPENMYKFRMQ